MRTKKAAIYFAAVAYDCRMGSRAAKFWISLGIAFLTFVAYGRICCNDFVNFDDPDYVTIDSNGRLGRSNLNGSSRRSKETETSGGGE